MKTKKIGELLRERREAHRLTIDQIARLTHIKPEYLQSIEANLFEALPPAVYVKGYVRTLAHIFGVEPDPMLALLRRDYKESKAGVLTLQEQSTRGRPLLWHSSTKWSVLLVSALLFTIAAYIVAQWLIALRPPKLIVDKFDQLEEITTTTTLTGRTSPDAFLLINDQPASLRPDGSFTYQLQLEQTGLVTIKIESRDLRGKSTVLERSVRVLAPLSQ